MVLNQWSIQQLRPGTVTSLKSFKVAVRIGSCFSSIIFLVLSQLVFYSFSQSSSILILKYQNQTTFTFFFLVYLSSDNTKRFLTLYYYYYYYYYYFSYLFLYPYSALLAISQSIPSLSLVISVNSTSRIEIKEKGRTVVFFVEFQPFVSSDHRNQYFFLCPTTITALRRRERCLQRRCYHPPVALSWCSLSL